MRPGDPRDMLDVADWNDGYRAGFDDATEARGGIRLAGCIVLLAALAIISAVSFAAGRVTAAAPRPASVIPASPPVAVGAPEQDRERTGAPSLWPSFAASPSDGAPPPTAVTIPPACGPDPCDANWLVRTGKASTYGEGWDGWTAIPEGPGYRIRVCGPSDCAELTTTDAGPSLAMQREGRIVDLDVPTFERVCGMPWRIAGLCDVSVTILRVPHG